MHSNNYLITYTDELCHYGVIGMKWGIHRSKEVKSVRKAFKKAYKLETSKARRAKLKKKYDKDLLTAKDKAAKRIFTNTGVNEKAQKRINRTGLGKAFAQEFAFGKTGSLVYNNLRSSGKDRLTSAGYGYVGNIIEYATMGVPSLVTSAKAIRNSDFGKSKKRK